MTPFILHPSAFILTPYAASRIILSAICFPNALDCIAGSSVCSLRFGGVAGIDTVVRNLVRSFGST